jgi:hypothetical protein
MTKSLIERLDAAKLTLDIAGGDLTNSGGFVTLGDQFRRSLATASSIPHWRELVIARNAARDLLVDLEKRVVDDDQVVLQFGTPLQSAVPMRVKYSHARLIGIEAYLSLTWALADRLSAFAGRVLCSNAGNAFHEQQSPKLVSHFVNSEKELSASTAGLVFDSIRQTFGWPIAISYALRNHFIHDGAQRNELNFFADDASTEKFKIRPSGWKQVRNQALGYSVLPQHIRSSANWPASPEDDLRVVLRVCEQEMDEALGILVGSACAALSSHLKLMTGND